MIGLENPLLIDDDAFSNHAIYARHFELKRFSVWPYSRTVSG